MLDWVHSFFKKKTFGFATTNLMTFCLLSIATSVFLFIKIQASWLYNFQSFVPFFSTSSGCLLFPWCLQCFLRVRFFCTYVHRNRQSHDWLNLTDCHHNTVLGLNPQHTHTYTHYCSVAWQGTWVTVLKMVKEPNVSPGQQSEQHVVWKTAMERFKLFCYIIILLLCTFLLHSKTLLNRAAVQPQ